ncbi:hypothetical protein Tco_1393709, partial [Tanacetum coccineum]
RYFSSESFPPLTTPVTTMAGDAPGKSSYANLTGKPNGKKLKVLTLFTPEGNREEARLLDYSPFNLAPWTDLILCLRMVKLHGVPVTTFSEDGLSAITTNLGTLLMLDSYTSDMCMQSWGGSSYARLMIELRADVEFKDNIVVAMPRITRRAIIHVMSVLSMSRNLLGVRPVRFLDIFIRNV